MYVKAEFIAQNDWYIRTELGVPREWISIFLSIEHNTWALAI